jgi:hypothetical protein
MFLLSVDPFTDKFQVFGEQLDALWNPGDHHTSRDLPALSGGCIERPDDEETPNIEFCQYLQCPKLCQGNVPFAKIFLAKWLQAAGAQMPSSCRKKSFLQ